MPVLQIMKEVGYQWQNLTPEEKQVYQKLADEDKLRYQKELKEFEKEVETLQIAKPQRGKASKTKKQISEVKSEPKPETKVKTKEKDNNKPSEVIEIKDEPKIEPLKSLHHEAKAVDLSEDYNKFYKGYTEILKKRDPKLSILELNSKIDEKWNSFNLNEKAKYSKNPKLLDNFVREETSTADEEVKMKVNPRSNFASKDDNLIKRPMNIARPDGTPQLPKLASTNIQNQSVRYQMQPERPYRKGSDQDGMMMPSGYKMSEEYNDAMNYDKIFPAGKSPPILDQRKRHRRLSSIVGIRSQPYGRDFEFDEVLEIKNFDGPKIDSRSPSIDYTGAQDQNVESPHYNDSRKSSVYYFAGIPHQSPIENTFTQHPVFRHENEAKNYRKQSTNFPMPDGSICGNYNQP